jgi:hypothetical protein
MTPGFRRDAQQRVDRIRAFSDELAELEGTGVLSLTPEQRAAVEQHHASLIADLTSRFDVDATESQKRVSWGMRIASLTLRYDSRHQPWVTGVRLLDPGDSSR